MSKTQSLFFVGLLLIGISGKSQDTQTNIYLFAGPTLLATRGQETKVTPIGEDFTPQGQLFIFDDVKKTSNKIGYYVGASLQQSIAKHFTLNLNLVWEQKSFVSYDIANEYFLDPSQKFIVSDSSRTSTYSVTNGYLIASLIPQFVVKNFKIGIGVYAAVLHKSRVSIAQDPIFLLPPAQPVSYFNGLSWFYKNDYGLSACLDYAFPYKSLRICVEFNDYYGLTPVNTIHSQLPFPPRTIYNNTYSLTVKIGHYWINRKISQLKINNKFKTL